MVKLKPYKDDVYLWEYVPSLIASIIFTICYLIVTFVVIIRMFRSQSWFCTPFTIGGLHKYLTRTVLYEGLHFIRNPRDFRVTSK